MEDKAFGLIEKMYNEFSGFRKDMNGFRKDMNEFRKETKEDIQRLSNDVLRIENDHGNKLDALFDGYNQTYEKLEIIEDKINTLSLKVDSHDIKIQVIEGGRK